MGECGLDKTLVDVKTLVPLLQHGESPLFDDDPDEIWGARLKK